MGLGKALLGSCGLVLALEQTAHAGCSVLLEGPADDPRLERMLVELRAAGFDATTAAADSEPTGASAVVRVVPGSAVTIRVVDAAGAWSASTDGIAVDDSFDASVVALRTAEILRARLLPEPPRPTPAPVEAQPAPLPAPLKIDGDAVAPRARARSTWGLDAGPQFLLSPGAGATATNLLLMPRWSSASRWTLRGLVSIPGASPTITASEGSATVATWLAGAAVEWRLGAPGSGWAAALGVGMAASRVRIEGRANPPFVSSSDDLYGWLPFAEASASRALWDPRVRIGLQVLAGADFPQPVVRFAGHEVASLDGPLLAGSLLLEVDAP